MPRRALLLAYWCVPPLLALIVYSKALQAWFFEDDFVWLSLVHDIHSLEDLRYALFHPTIHGTWRPLGERIYFVVLNWLFGPMSAVPFRMVAFAWTFANLALLSAVTLRITRSRIAGLLAPILWIANDKQVMLMVWNSDINYIACAFYMLLALWFLIRHTETTKAGYFIGMWAAFLCSLGALEMAVTFPAIAATYTWVCARKYFTKTLPMLAASALFAILHKIYAPDQAIGVYHMHLDASIFSTLAQYWQLAMVPENLSIFTRFSEGAGVVAMAMFTVALLGYSAYQATRRNWIPAMLLTWFVILIAPVLPLRDHVTDYYVALPALGLVMLAADAVARAWAQPVSTWRLAAAALVALFLAESIPVAYKATRWNANRSSKVRTMVLAVNEAQTRHPGATIVLEGIDSDLFWAGIQARCFGFLGYEEVYIDASSLPFIEKHPEVDDPAKFVLQDGKIQELKGEGKLAAYQWTGSGIVDRTSTIEGKGFTPPAPPAAGERVDVGNPAFSDRLGDSWFPITDGSRWMPKQATVRMHLPDARAHRLQISGYCPAALLKDGPLHLTVTINGRVHAPVSIAKPDAFEFEFPIPAGLPKEFDVRVEVDRTTRVPPDQRDLGVVFGVFEIL